DIKHPFDSFSASVDLNQPGTLVSRIEERGVLKGWEVTESTSSSRHILGFAQEYEYLNNHSEVFGAQAFSAAWVAGYGVPKYLLAVTDVSTLVLPLAGVQTTDFTDPMTGRTYDYGVGAGFRTAVRVFWKGQEVIDAGYGLAWVHTVNGRSDESVLQSYRGSIRVPIAGPVGIGGGYNWYSRKTTYTGFFESRKTQSEWRAFISLAFSERWGQVTT